MAVRLFRSARASTRCLENKNPPAFVEFSWSCKGICSGPSSSETGRHEVHHAAVYNQLIRTNVMVKIPVKITRHHAPWQNKPSSKIITIISITNQKRPITKSARKCVRSSPVGAVHVFLALLRTLELGKIGWWGHFLCIAKSERWFSWQQRKNGYFPFPSVALGGGSLGTLTGPGKFCLWNYVDPTFDLISDIVGRGAWRRPVPFLSRDVPLVRYHFQGLHPNFPPFLPLQPP